MKIPYPRPMAIAGASIACAGLLWLQLNGHYVNFTGLLWVLGGTLLATVLGRSPTAVKALLRDLPRRLREPAEDKSADVEFFLDIAGLYRQGNIHTAEQSVRILTDPILRSGVEMILDRTPREDLVRLLQWKSGALREHDQAEIQILRTMMMLAPPSAWWAPCWAWYRCSTSWTRPSSSKSAAPSASPYGARYTAWSWPTWWSNRSPCAWSSKPGTGAPGNSLSWKRC
nr:hypothetical protein [Methylogaea oryzae]